MGQKITLIFTTINNLVFVLVPSGVPSYIRMTNVTFNQVKVQWDPLPQQFANGRLLGYTIYYHEYYYPYTKKSLKTRSPYVSMVILRGLKAATRYQIAVAAFTSKGVGTQSYSQHITTGNILCIMLLNFSYL